MGLCYTKQQQPVMKSPFRKSYNLLMAAFSGDALGAYVQFKNKHIIRQQIDTVMKMPGGGTFSIVQGQVTDDSEMSLSMIHSIIQTGGVFQIENVAKHYHLWYKSDPFDIGITTRNALQIKNSKQNFYRQMSQNAKKLNQGSLSNGCLMRIHPLPVYFYQKQQKDIQKIRQLVFEQVSITHSNKIAQQACFIWVMSVLKLLQNKTPQQVLLYTKQLIKKYQYSQLIKWWECTKQPIDATVSIGFIKIAWTYGYYYLGKLAENPRQITFKKIMRDVILRGGDTDTNACIVGGMVGAVVQIQDQYQTKLMKCKSDRKLSKDKPLHPKMLLQYLQILNIAPKL